MGLSQWETEIFKVESHRGGRLGTRRRITFVCQAHAWTLRSVWLVVSCSSQERHEDKQGGSGHPEQVSGLRDTLFLLMDFSVLPYPRIRTSSGNLGARPSFVAVSQSARLPRQNTRLGLRNSREGFTAHSPGG